MIAGSILIDERMMLTLYIRNEETRNIVFEKVAPHFKEIKVIYVVDKIQALNMQFPQESTFQLFHNSNADIKELIHDIYRTNDISVWKPDHERDLAYYRVEFEQSELVDIPRADELKRLLREEYFNINEPFVLIPTGWAFNKVVGESIALKFFATFVPEIKMYVNKIDDQVVAIELNGRRS